MDLPQGLKNFSRGRLLLGHQMHCLHDPSNKKTAKTPKQKKVPSYYVVIKFFWFFCQTPCAVWGVAAMARKENHQAFELETRFLTWYVVA